MRAMSAYNCISIGVAVATAFCAIPSPAITSTTQWTFGVTDTSRSDYILHILIHYSVAHIF